MVSLLHIPRARCAYALFALVSGLLTLASGSFVTVRTTVGSQRRAALQPSIPLRPSPTLFASRQTAAKEAAATSSSANDDSSIIPFLKASGYGHRIVRLQNNNDDNDDDARRVVEVFLNGETVLGRLVEIVASTTSTNNLQSSPSPRAIVTFLDDSASALQDDHEPYKTTTTTTTVDLGQITTIWSAAESRKFDKAAYSVYRETLRKVKRYQSNPVALDAMLDKVYARFVRQGRKNPSKLSTKKSSSHDNEHIAQIAKKLQKTGPAYSRLLDSLLLTEHLPSSSAATATTNDPLVSRAVASLLLTNDAKQGGRFKRWPCMVASSPSDKNIDDKEWNIINGGWLVVDQNVRAGTEARKLMERSNGGEHCAKSSSSSSSTTTTTRHSVADERIIQRLECLAMGEILDANAGAIKLEKHVRETLRTMQLSFSSQGACDALVQLGRWTASTRSKLKNVVQPWAPQILEAAAWYTHAVLHQEWKDETNRTDLRKLPCLCVDAKSTSFRDDAMGVRPRASTGRWVNEEASKWEILVHITDMSDIYAPSHATIRDAKGYLPILQKASESRGISRYDLPLGPLHLLPPTVLEAMSFSENKAHRCVTVWVYIDERDGRLLDAGFERSVVGPSSHISYAEASKMMDLKGASLPKDVARLRSVLLVIEKVLSVWKDRRVRDSEQASKRENRFASREANKSEFDEESGNGRASFQRTRGHRLVDSCLDVYSYAGWKFLQKSKAPIPMARGAGVSKGGRLATAPLRRYIDGQAQRQLLAVLLGHGEPMTLEESRLAGRVANNARNAISNVRAGRTE